MDGRRNNDCSFQGLKMQIQFTQKEINLAKQVAVFATMVSAMGCLAYFNIEMYKFLVMCAGGWFIGTSLGKWSRAKWPA